MKSKELRTLRLVLVFTSTLFGATNTWTAAVTNDMRWGAPEPLPRLIYAQNVNLVTATFFQGLDRLLTVTVFMAFARIS